MNFGATPGNAQDLCLALYIGIIHGCAPENMCSGDHFQHAKIEPGLAEVRMGTLPAALYLNPLFLFYNLMFSLEDFFFCEGGLLLSETSQQLELHL